ncbi:putative transposase [Escherichia coli 3-267-03_S4_C1]|nr:putative transposase [Escherichia coli 3-267-03_S4_C1]
MPAFEWVHVQLHQQKGMISLSPPTICNSADNPFQVFQPCSTCRLKKAAWPPWFYFSHIIPH